MNLTLTRKEYSGDGIFGELNGESGELIAATLEHSYECRPKLGAGTYLCRRGLHRLHPDAKEFETFEVTEVPGHKGILFHRGNTEGDSAGCVLLGLRRDGSMIVGSKLAFEAFMKLQAGVEEFRLLVVDAAF